MMGYSFGAVDFTAFFFYKYCTFGHFAYAHYFIQRHITCVEVRSAQQEDLADRSEAW